MEIDVDRIMITIIMEVTNGDLIRHSRRPALSITTGITAIRWTREIDSRRPLRLSPLLLSGEGVAMRGNCHRRRLLRIAHRNSKGRLASRLLPRQLYQSLIRARVRLPIRSITLLLHTWGTNFCILIFDLIQFEDKNVNKYINTLYYFSRNFKIMTSKCKNNENIETSFNNNIIY